MDEPHEKNMGRKLLFWFSLQGGLPRSKSSYIPFTCMGGEPHEKNMGGKLLFWFILQGGL
jgi:hypothetical protein